MKRIISSLLIMTMAVCLIACANRNEQNDSLINIVGAFYCNDISEDGYHDMYVVFDYTNDSVNRVMPVEASKVLLSANEVNVYEATINEIYSFAHHNETYEASDYGWFERYTGYKYVLGYGNLMGGAEPVRMFVNFKFNPNDLKNSENITLTVDDQITTFPTSEIEKISIIDEILKCEENYETFQMVSAGKWRLDTAYRTLFFLSTVTAPYGEDLSAMASGMKKLFSEESKGASVIEEPQYALNPDTYTYNKIVENLPSYDHVIMLQECPEVATEITNLVNDWNLLAASIENPNSKVAEVEKLMINVLNYYCDICNYWEIEYAPK